MIFQMAKRKLTLQTSSLPKKRKTLSLPTPAYVKNRGRGYAHNFGKSFFGTLGDPFGTVISLFKGENPSWNRHKGIKSFDHRKGFINFANILNSLGQSYLTDIAKKGVEAITRRSAINLNDPRLLAYKVYHRYPVVPHTTLIRYDTLNPYTRHSGIGSDALNYILQNQTLRSLGKTALTSAAGVILPAALQLGAKYIFGDGKKKKKHRQNREVYEEMEI